MVLTRRHALTLAALMLAFFALGLEGADRPMAAAHPAIGGIQPDAGRWRTWVLAAGSELRLPPPPDAATVEAEIAELRTLAAGRDESAFIRGRADEAGMSRLASGIHYRSDIEVGLVLGRAVARRVIERTEADNSP